MAELLVNANATGSTEFWGGGAGTFAVTGGFNGATVALEYLGPDQTTWIKVGQDAVFAEPSVVTVELARGSVRAAVDGGAPSQLYADLQPLVCG